MPSPNTQSQSLGEWVALPEDAPRKASEAPRNCECGCNEYSPAVSPSEFPRAHSVDSLPDIPALPLLVEYEDDDGPSDDHEYVSIKATEFADMVSALRSCTCQTDTASD